jgi:hypothetical protein
MTLPKVPIYKIVWNGNDGEVWYTDPGGAADYLRALLGGFGFCVGTQVAAPDSDGFLQALPVVSQGCSLTALQTVLRNAPGVEIGRVMGELQCQPVGNLARRVALGRWHLASLPRVV